MQRIIGSIYTHRGHTIRPFAEGWITSRTLNLYKTFADAKNALDKSNGSKYKAEPRIIRVITIKDLEVENG